MPGNEVGDRVHNFFEQGSLSQDQRHTQLVEGNWPVFNNNLWGGSERQPTGPLNSSSKNYSAQQSDIERGQGKQFSLGPHGLSFIEPNLRPEFVKNQSQLQQLNLNGFMHSSQVVPTRQNESNFLGVDTEPDRHNLTSRGLSSFESQHRSGSQHTNSASFGGSESPMNFNFLGGQQQVNGQQPGMLQSLSRQQSNFNDAQMMQQQQAILKQMQMQDLQRHQQLQQIEAMQRSAVSQMPTFPSQMAGQHPPGINGNPLHDASNYPWSSQVMAGNTNWAQRGQSSAVQGYPNGLMMTPEQGQAMRFMGLTPQQASQSLYGVPVSSSRTANPYSHNNIDKPLQGPAPSSSFSANQYAPLSEQVCMQDGTNVSRSGSEGNSLFERASSQGLGNMVNAGSFNLVQQRNVPISKSGRQDSAGGSELLLEKSVSQPAPSQGAVALDPTEEKILFGNDESIWEAFGGSSLTGTGSVSRLDAPDLSNGFPSMQSGTWSALMQSAVAEASNSDAGGQEEWSGLDSQNSRSQSGYQQSSDFHDNEKKQPVWVDSSQRASMGPRTATSDVSTPNYHNNSALRQPFSNQTDSQIPEDGRKWLNRNSPKPHAEQSRSLENANSSRDCSKTDAGFWSRQPHNSGQPFSRPSALNFIESMPVNGSIASTNQDNLHDNLRNRDMCMGAGAAMRVESMPNSYVKMGSPHVNSMDDSVAPNLSNMKVNHESSPQLPDTNHLDLWKSVNSSVNSGSAGSGKDQHNLNKVPPVLESSGATPDGGTAEMHETVNSDRRESSNDSHRSSIPHHAPAGGLRENVWSDVGDRHSLPGGKEKSSGQAVKKPPVTRKFQYHPMGDVDMDVESSYAAKQVLHSQPMSQHVSSVVKGHETQPRFLGPSSNNSMDIEKGRVPSFQGAVKMSHGVPSSGIHPGYFPNTSSPFVRSGEMPSSNQHVLSSQNMLELLHKVDQSKEQSVVPHPSSSDCNRMSDITSGGPSQSQSSTSHGFSLQLAPPSQGIAPSNLHVGSQSTSTPVDSPSSSHIRGDKAHAWLTSVSSAQCLPPSHHPPQMQSGNNRSGPSGVLGSMEADGSLQNVKGKLSGPLTSGSPYSRNPYQNQPMTASGGKIISDQSAALSYDRHAHHNSQISGSQDQAAAIQSISNSHHNLASGRNMNQSGMRALMHQMPVSAPPVMPGMSRKDNMSPLGANLWMSQQHLLGAQSQNASNPLKPQFSSNDTSETSSFTQQKKNEQDVPRREDASSSQGIGGDEPLAAEAQSTGKSAGAQEEEPTARHPSDASPSNSTASQKDIEAFHHSLKSNNAADHSYSLLHQMQTMRSSMMDPSHRESKRLKGQDNGPDSQLIASMAPQPFTSGVNNAVRDPSISRMPISAGDTKMLSFSPQPGNKNTSFQFPHGAVASQDLLSFGRSDPQKFAPGSITSRVEHTGISPQMAPSWFEQYGTFKNGQLLPVHNVPRIPVTKNVEQQFINEKSPNNLAEHCSVQPANSVADTHQVATTCQTMSSYIPSEHVSSQNAVAPHVPTPSIGSMRPKKRKTATSDLVSWNKEIEQGLKRLQNMSSAEMDWAQSSNRVVEKVEDETDTSEDLLRMVRPKRRLILTTQLMQQVFRPPSAAVLSLDTSSNHEIIVYSLGRLALGDACSLICCMEGDSPINVGSRNLLSEKIKTSERIRDQYFSKVMEDFSNRAKELESDLLRLDKRASILDFRLDCQDLERFSVINRFARFHGRSQVDGAETSSSSDATTMAQKPCPQRYVSAHPMPRNVPERVQCLSL